jgi:hypothetical protein
MAPTPLKSAGTFPEAGVAASVERTASPRDLKDYYQGKNSIWTIDIQVK